MCAPLEPTGRGDWVGTLGGLQETEHPHFPQQPSQWAEQDRMRTSSHVTRVLGALDQGTREAFQVRAVPETTHFAGLPVGLFISL